LHRVIIVAIIITFLTVLGLAIGAAADEGFKTTLVNGLTVVGGTVFTAAQGAWQQILILASANGTTFLIYTLVMIAVGGIFWVAVVTPLWSIRPGWMGNRKQIAVVTSPQSQLSTPELYTPQQQQTVAPVTVPIIVKPIVEEKKEAVPA